MPWRTDIRLRLVPALTAGAAFAAGVVLAIHHPVWPTAALLLFAAWCVASWRFPGAWLFVLPACLPLMSFSPWTGWIVFDEFDLLVLGAAAGTAVRLALDPPPLAPRARIVALLMLATGLVGAQAFAHGLGAEGLASFGWHDGHADALNALRVFKSLLGALLLLPSLRFELEPAPQAATGRIGAGMLAGLSVVVAAVLWERAAYPGLFDFADSYRTVALFWEMHVGGAAIDAYLALAVPFVVWGVLCARDAPRWTAAAVLALLVEYACLTTFSRGVYVAVAAGLILLALLLARRAAPPLPSRRLANAALVALLLVEAGAVVGSDSFMVSRLRRTAHDFGSRIAHWQHGIDLLHGPLQWALGKGLGRLPAEYARAVPAHEMSGRVLLLAQGAVRLQGPDRLEAIAGLYGLTQRIPLRAGEHHRVELDLRAAKPVRLGVSVCELHLLYEAVCQQAEIRVPAGADWQRRSATLNGPRLRPPRTAVFTLSVLDTGAAVELGNVVLHDAQGASLLINGDFSDGLARWLPAARLYYVPWHIDNLYLELLIEQGVIGLVVFGVLAALALARLQRCHTLPLAPYFTASLAGVLLLGLVSSVLDVPRVAFLMLLLLFVSLQLDPAR